MQETRDLLVDVVSKDTGEVDSMGRLGDGRRGSTRCAWPESSGSRNVDPEGGPLHEGKHMRCLVRDINHCTSSRTDSSLGFPCGEALHVLS